jgi:hypothetical protein
VTGVTRFALLAIVAALALVGAGCGGDDEATETDPTVAWADGFCDALVAWRTEAEEIVETTLDDPSSLSIDTLRDAGDDLVAVTTTMIDDIRGLDRPETESGDEIESAVDDLADTIESEKAEVEVALEGADGIEDVLSAGSTISSSVSAVVAAVDSARSQIEAADAGGELESAFEQADSCDQLSADD